MINIVTALPAEARPLRDHFKLCDKLQNTAFALYRNADTALIVAGPGKVAAAAATAVLAGITPASTTSAWQSLLNRFRSIELNLSDLHFLSNC